MIVLHGSADVVCHPVHAEHAARIVPKAELRMIDDLGHVSIEDHIVPALADMLAPPSG